MAGQMEKGGFLKLTAVLDFGPPVMPLDMP